MVIISGIESQLIAVSFIAIHLVNILVGAVLSCVLPLLMCLFCSFRSSFQNSACSFQKQRNCRYSNFPYFSGFLRCNRKKSLKYQAFRQIQSCPKPPSKITKQPLTHKTRNQVVAQAARGFESHPIRQKTIPRHRRGIVFAYAELYYFEQLFRQDRKSVV